MMGQCAAIAHDISKELRCCQSVYDREKKGKVPNVCIVWVQIFKRNAEYKTKQGRGVKD